MTFVTQIVCPLLSLFCRFLRMQSVFDRDLLIQLLVGHTPLHKNLLTSSSWGCGRLVNRWDRDDLSTTDKSHAPNVSAVQRFHCSTHAWLITTLLDIRNNNS